MVTYLTRKLTGQNDKQEKITSIGKQIMVRLFLLTVFSVIIVSLNVLTSLQSTPVVYGATVLPGQGVDIEQVDFLFPAATHLDSDWGRVSVNSSLLNSATGIPKGFLNIFTDAGWVVQNLPIDLSDGVNPVVTYFSLGLNNPDVPFNVNSLSAHIWYSRFSKVDFSDGNRCNYPVDRAEWNAEGFGDCPTTSIGAAPPPNMVKFDAKDITFKRTQPNLTNVQTAFNQCFPMSIANSLQYLEDRFGINVPHDHKPGLKGDNSLVGQLDTEAGRTTTARNNGNGVNVGPMLKGKFSYLSKNGLKDKVVHRHQGRGFGNGVIPNGDFTSSGITSKDRGDKVTFEFINNQIRNGEDVELCFSYDTLQGIPTGGHAVRVFECGKTKGQPWIGYAHDSVQTNQDPKDEKGLETVRVNIKDIDGDKLLNLGSKDRECRFVLSESVKQ
ncbi:MAG TPA: hypothetical protein ACFYDZ_10105 [Candidatus Brocadiaceae bacterium]